MKTFIYSNPLSSQARPIFCWVAGDREKADEAFEEVIGVHPSRVFGVRCEEKEVSEKLREARLVK